MGRTVGSAGLLGHKEIRTTHPWGMNMMAQGYQEMKHKGVVIVGSEGGGPNHAVQLEQKSVSWIRNLMTKLSKGGQLVVDLCAGTFSGGNVCMMIPKHRWIV